MQIFTGIFPRHYDPPDGFTFEVNDVSPPIQVRLFVVKNIHMALLNFCSRGLTEMIFLIEG